MRTAITVLVLAGIMAFLVVGTVLVVGMPGSQTGSSTQSSSDSYSSSSVTSSSSVSTSSTTSQLANTIAAEDTNDNLQLRLSLNATIVAPGHAFAISISEFNTLTTTNNVTSANYWALDGLELGPCGHSYGPTQGPLGVEVFSGRYTAANVSQAQPLGIYPSPVACPQFIRVITGFYFQPLSDIAFWLPSFGGNGTAVAGSVTVGSGYPDYSSAGQPLSPGTYTVVGGDEWGNLLFVYVQVT